MNGLSTRLVYLCLTFAVSLATAGTAFISPVAAAEPLVAPSWTGFYAGVHGGWGWGSTHISDPANLSVFNPTEYTFNGPLAGGQLGANWQSGNIVYGAELAGSWAYVRGNTSGNQTIITSSTNNAVDFRALFTGAGRIGYAMNSWLAYAKAGVAVADLQMTARFTPDTTTYNRTPFGAVGGVGLEVAFLRNVSATLEYNALYFPTEHLVLVNPNTTSSVSHLVQLVKAGINVRLGGDSVASR